MVNPTRVKPLVADGRPSRLRSVLPRCARIAVLSALAILLAVGTVTAGAFSAETGQGRELRGKLEDGTDYMICVPAKWNGVVFNDLDMIWWEKRPIFQHLLREGYAIAGTRRRTGPRRTGHWCEFANMRRVQETLTIFRAKIGEPKRVIAIGCSAGGAVAIATAEAPYERIHAAIAMCATTGALTVNQAFDLFFILKGLLAPDDPDLRFYDLPPANSPELQVVQERWLKLLESVSGTPEGKARIALACTMAQYAELMTAIGKFRCTTARAEDPVLDLDNPEAVADAMSDMLRTQLVRIRLGILREDNHLAGGRWIGNEGADYVHYYQNGHPDYKKVVQALYLKAGLDIEAEIDRVIRQPRVRIDPEAASEMFDRRTHRGTPKIPLFRLDQIADPWVPTQQARVYADHIRRTGLGDLYRASVVDSRGHCSATLAEQLTVIRAVEHRLDTGEWPATDARSLNERAASLDLGPARFVDYRHRRFNGQWRLHAFSAAFDLSFQDLRNSLARFHQENQVTELGKEQLLTLLTRAHQHHDRKEWHEAKDALAAFQKTASDTELVPGEEAGTDLAWDARMMGIQVERELR